jgi:thiosulfate dehydrogenase
MPANADAKPSKLETWAAKTSLHATLRREAPKAPNPLPLDDANLIAGIKLYGANCIVCHGGADAKVSNVARGLYQHAPQLAKDGVEDDPDGVTYWKLAHGIRLTGMPAFGPTLQERQLWQLTLFLKHMDRLPPAADKAWKALKNPAQLMEPQPQEERG